MQATFTHMLDLLGVKRVEDLLFKCNSNLIGRVKEVEAIREDCHKCGRPNLIAWNYTELDGGQKTYRLSTICSNCINGTASKELTDEMINKRQGQLMAKWYQLEASDTSGFKNYERFNKATEKAYIEAVEYTKNVIVGGNLTINLLMMGSTGTGKSHLAKTIAKTAKDKGLAVAYIEAVELFNMIKKTFGNDTHKELFMKEYKSFDLVVIDDVGLETKKHDELSWSVTEWTGLLNAREGKATVFTTNFDDEKLAGVIGQRAYSRMYTNTKFIDLFTDDYRKKKRV